MSKNKDRLIPAYDYSGDPVKRGKRIRPYSLSAAEDLISRSAVVGVRNKRGTLLAILWRSEVGGDPRLRRMQAGQKYSVLVGVGHGMGKVYKFTDLSGPRALYEPWRSIAPESTKARSAPPDMSTDGRRNQQALVAP